MKKVVVLSVMMNFVVANGSENEKNSGITHNDICSYPNYEIGESSSELSSYSSDGSSEENDSEEEGSHIRPRSKKWENERRLARIKRRGGQLKKLKHEINLELAEELSKAEHYALLVLRNTVERKQIDNACAEAFYSISSHAQKVNSLCLDVQSFCSSQHEPIRRPTEFDFWFKQQPTQPKGSRKIVSRKKALTRKPQQQLACVIL